MEVSQSFVIEVEAPEKWIKRSGLPSTIKGVQPNDEDTMKVSAPKKPVPNLPQVPQIHPDMLGHEGKNSDGRVSVFFLFPC